MTRLTPVAAALCLLAGAARADTTVHDGDGIVIDGQPYRVWGVDSPELSQTCQRPGAVYMITYRCGVEARDALVQFIAGRPVTCQPLLNKKGRPVRNYDRIVATCSVGGEDVGAWLVLHGHAVDWRAYSRGAYADEQAEAEAADAGIWAGPFKLVKSKVEGE